MSAALVDLLRNATEELSDAGIEGAARDARLLLAHAAGLSAARLGAELGEAAAPEVAARFQQMIGRRLARAPVSHITGKRFFFNHEFIVTPDVLDPRPETETLVLAALEGPVRRVLDLGTGSGVILLSVLGAREDASGLGTDLSPAALGVARQNAARLGVEARCAFRVSDWFAQVEGQFDLIVSNPPYIALDEMEDLAPELAHEPRMALTDGAGGLTAYRAITRDAGRFLTPGGRLMVEIGWRQGADVAAMMRAAGLRDVAILPDMDGRDRVVLGRSAT
ncbi:peptide chain release factor N(5)-glutamine methyltransferase [Pelagivirga sediminicola]|uniref:Release factor glutamine methyltransferase n=1 Tax=Pelagivirga sediminicola TaxID=2170575 RepID=A0A2T7GBL3_9RHOB|nr:peptide chain release factor N(5)-glutamine methyltransferase [Pelagivirga sediminicola]PVA11796.1 peptide chain release factor N(5)-glutamine methyltransferase [Pelagivirga sediminicola]